MLLVYTGHEPTPPLVRKGSKGQKSSNMWSKNFIPGVPIFEDDEYNPGEFGFDLSMNFCSGISADILHYLSR